MAVTSYQELVPHVGHRIVCVTYGPAEDPHNVALECEDCSEVLIDFDAPAQAPQDQQPQPTGKQLSITRARTHVEGYVAESDRELPQEGFSAARDLVADILIYAAELPAETRPPAYGPDSVDVVGQLAAGGVWCALAGELEDPTSDELTQAHSAFSAAIG